MPSFSIIIPVHDTAHYLRECLDSLSAQTFDDWEAICVDDGSTDGSSAILDEYAAIDSRFRTVHQTNSGVGHARNVGLSKCTGDYVLFLDSDDCLRSDTLEFVMSCFMRFPKVDFVRFGYVEFEENSEPVWNVIPSRLEVRDVSRSVSLDSFHGYLFQSAYRKAVLSGVEFPSLIHGEDRVFFVRVLDRARCIAVTDAVLYGYRQRAGSATHDRVSVRRFEDYDSHRFAILDIIGQSRKRYDELVFGPFFYKKFTRNNTEWYFERTSDPADRRLIFSSWMKSLRRAGTIRCIPFPLRVRMLVLGFVRSPCLMWILYESRRWLRRNGIRNPFRKKRNG